MCIGSNEHTHPVNHISTIEYFPLVNNLAWCMLQRTFSTATRVRTLLIIKILPDPLPGPMHLYCRLKTSLRRLSGLRNPPCGGHAVSTDAVVQSTNLLPHLPQLC
eukprot:366519-Chlamydomonas_euryale.AAC.21